MSNSKPLKNLDVRHRRAIPLLLDGKTNAEIGEELGVRADVVSQWKSDPLFWAKLEEARELWEADLRDQRLAHRQTRLRILDDEIQGLIDRRADAAGLGDDIGVSRRITANVVAAGREMANVDLEPSSAAQGRNPRGSDPNDPEVRRKLAAWIRAMAADRKWNIRTVVVEDLCAFFEVGTSVEEAPG